MSKLEENIISVLKKEKVYFEREKTFKDLRNGKLRFDFFLPKFQNGCLIEIDGEQHFHKITKFQKTRAEFLKAQERDRIKNSYCLARGIKLYRIPYWEVKNIKKVSDIFQYKFLVKNKWHNDFLKEGK